jgi:glycosyltransferase involved in cell wall biosynthesis
MTLRIAAVSHAAVIAANQEPFSALAEAGAEVTVLAPRQLRTDLRGVVGLEALTGSNARVVGLPVSIGGYSKRLGGQRGIHVILYRGLAKTLRLNSPDVVFIEEEPYSFAAFQAARWCARNQIPFVVHQNQNLERNLPLPFRLIERFVLKRAAGATVRNTTAEPLLRSKGFTAPIEMFPHGIDLSTYNVEPNAVDLPGPVVGFFGRLVPEKGILDLVRALGAVRATSPASLLVVGDGPERVKAEATAHRLNIPAMFVGVVAHHEVPSWIRACDLIVVPSGSTKTWTEQFGRVPIEANAAGVPVLASDSGELPATVHATRGGLVYSGEQQLQELLGEMLRDDQRRQSLGQAGRRGVTEQFTHKAIASRLLAFLQGVNR